MAPAGAAPDRPVLRLNPLGESARGRPGRAGHAPGSGARPIRRTSEPLSLCSPQEGIARRSGWVLRAPDETSRFTVASLRMGYRMFTPPKRKQNVANLLSPNLRNSQRRLRVNLSWHGPACRVFLCRKISHPKMGVEGRKEVNNKIGLSGWK